MAGRRKKKKGQTPAQRRNQLARQRGFKNYAAERLAKGIAKGRTPEQARGRPKAATQKTVRSKTARKLLERRAAPRTRGEAAAIAAYNLEGLPTQTRRAILYRLMRKWDAAKGRGYAVAYRERVDPSPEYPQGYRSEVEFVWVTGSYAAQIFATLVDGDRIVYVIERNRKRTAALV